MAQSMLATPLSKANGADPTLSETTSGAADRTGWAYPGGMEGGV